VGDSVGAVEHPAADRRRRSFGAAAQDYARLRPAYPDELVDRVLAGATRPVRDVADIGAGTGTLTRSLLPRAITVTALEPDTAMLAELGQQLPGVRRVRAAAEHLPVADDRFDAVLCGAAWHWFDDVVVAAEVGRVLRPGGVLGLLWHVRDDRVAWMSALTDLLGGDEGMRDEAAGDRMRARIEQVLPGAELTSAAMTVVMAPDDVVGLCSTYSTVLLAPDPDGVRRRIRELLATHPDTAGRAVLEVPYVVRAYRWRP
jgi:SAM-dependent methyltransferase